MDFEWEDNRGWTFSPEEALLWIIGIFARNHILKLKALTLVHQFKKVTHRSIVDKNVYVKKTVIKIWSLGAQT